MLQSQWSWLLRVENQKTDMEAVLLKKKRKLLLFIIKYSPDQETIAIDKTFFQQNQRFSIWDRIIIYILGVFVSSKDV